MSDKISDKMSDKQNQAIKTGDKQTISKQLAKCPFCGEELELIEERKLFAHKSNKCFLYDFCFPTYLEEAIKAWNTRKPMERILERLEEKQNNWENNYNVAKRCGDISRMHYADGYADGVAIAFEVVEMASEQEAVKEEGGIE